MSRPSVYAFVYGTLKRHGALNYHLGSMGGAFISDATLEGHALYDLGWFPAIAADADQRVHGELWKIPEEGLDTLDRVEGAPALYTREKVRVYTPAHPRGVGHRGFYYDIPSTPAWAYIWSGTAGHLPNDKKILSGRWPVDGGSD